MTPAATAEVSKEPPTTDVAHTSTLVMLPIYMLATFLPPVFAQLGIYSYFISRARVAERRGAVRPRLAAGVR